MKNTCYLKNIYIYMLFEKQYCLKLNKLLFEKKT